MNNEVNSRVQEITIPGDVNINNILIQEIIFYPNTLPSGLAERKASLRLKNIQNQDLSADDVGLGMIQTE